MEQEIIDKIEDIHSEIRENRKAINKVYLNLNLFALGVFIVGLLAGYGMNITKALWIMLVFGFFREIYILYTKE
jgi:hypothetical protein